MKRIKNIWRFVRLIYVYTSWYGGWIEVQVFYGPPDSRNFFYIIDKPVKFWR